MASAAAKPAQPDRCPRCDGSVGCGIATGACWCAEVTLSPERQKQLAAAFDGCLCPACLRELEQGDGAAGMRNRAQSQ
jgi:ribosomal protein L34E